MGGDYIFFMLDDAITLLPEAKLRNLVENYLNTAAFCADGTRKQNLLADAIAFQKASLSGSYYNGRAGRGRIATKTPSKRCPGLPIAVASRPLRKTNG